MMRYIAIFLAAVLVISMTLAASGAEVLSPAEGGRIPLSNVAGKKLIRGARETRHASQAMMEIKDPREKAAFLQKKVASWQDKGIDGVMFFLHHGRWWEVPGPTYEELKPEIDAFQSVKDWGRLTDNFMWTYSTVWAEGGRVPDWFNDDDWEAVLASARLAARVTKECGFKGILFDLESYGGPGVGVWKHAFDYKMYAAGGYKAGGEAKPKSFAEVTAKVQQRGKEYGEALTSVYPDIVLLVGGSLYGQAYKEALGDAMEGKVPTLPTMDHLGLEPAFLDGLLLGLDERASLVSAYEPTYLDSTYKDMLGARDQGMRLSLVLSKVPELARRRISFCTAIWTDAGWSKEERFSPTDVRLNQRDPERHKHAAHNAMAVSDKYGWLYGELPFITAEETPLMRQYWQANIDAHEPMDLGWEPVPKWDLTDYTAHDRQMAKQDAAFWARMKKDGWKVAVELPVNWHFRFDTQRQIRYKQHWYRTNNTLDNSAWPLISTLKCWQSQGTKANGIGIYRVNFDVPKYLNPKRQEIVLAFGGFSAGTSPARGMRPEIIAFVNTKLSFGMKDGPVNVSKVIKPGETNQVSVRVINHAGPAGLMGHVKLLVRNRRN